ncbi:MULTISPECIES: hypothetical protein [Streptomyces]|uniref:DUF3159 domain-containing protein n=1 Tax=Streptomyces doudnae TaxID=3075536 RepID=A0ABD5EG78_9ACTN|nr:MULTISPECIES: hypothetical protein [unclassified Streptomyces]MDT0433631.1 hypothetical protein [Streptomyces sp. DSM 41981]MYQ64076.1 hypothetical protein [Streptomyces sp. SID4950]SCD71292.1 hypothetical protein GA0115242_112511 [Streptomyces sp. SolWspMP-5a-2]
MKATVLVLSFVPLIVFSLLARVLPAGGIGIAALVAAVLALGALLVGRPIWPPKIISVLSLVLFAVLAVLGFTLGHQDDSRLATWGGAGVGVVLGLLVLALVPVLPFTEQFAREQVPRSAWDSPVFRRINRVLSTAWGVAIVALGVSRILAASLERFHAIEVIFGLIVPVWIIVQMVRFTKTYPERVTRGESRSG